MKADFFKAAGLVLAIALASGCAASRAFNKAEQVARGGDWDAAVTYYEQAVEANPNEATYKIALDRAKLAASRVHIDKAIALEEKNDLEGAIVEYKKAAEYDPTNRRASGKAADLEKVVRDRAEAARPRPQYEQMKDKVRQVAAEPLLNPASRAPLVFKFAQGITVKQILDFLAQAAGINVMFESTYQEGLTTKSAIDLDGVSLEQALNLVLTSNNLFYKVLNPKTILIIPDNPQNRGKYEDQVIKTFYLSHADATEMLTLLNGILGQANAQNRPFIQPNKGANSITIRGGSSLVAIAERVIENNDKPRAEVVIDVEILEVNRTRVKQYGLNLSNYAIGVQFSPEAPPGQLTTPSTGNNATGGTPVPNTGQFNLNTLVHGINTSDFYLTVPSAVVKFLESDSKTKLVAKPSLRGAEGSKLVANLGDEIPVPSTTFQPLISGGTAINPMTSYQYRPVGVNVSVTPRVTYDGDIILDLEVESSTKGSDVNVAGTNLPSFGTRKVTTRMRLRDGESNLLAGLLRDDERKSLTGFPGGIHVPVIKQLFSANDNQISQTDIVMLLTPHIIRTQALTERNLQEIYIGTRDNPVLGGTPPLIGAPADATSPQGRPPMIEAPAVSNTPTQPITQMPYGSPGSQLVGGAPVGPTTAAGTPVVPPGSSPIPGTVMMPPRPAQQPAVQPPTPAVTVPQAQTAVTPTPTVPTQPATPPPTAPTPTAPTPAATPPPTAQGAAGAAPATGAATGTAKPPAATPAQVTITTPGPDWRVGQGPYTVTLSALNMPRVTTVTLTVTFNPTALKLRSLQEGSFMRSGVPGTAFAHQEDNAAGRIDLTISRSGDIVGATGGGTLAALVFDAAAAGTVNFRVSGVATGPGGNIPLQFTPATVTVR